MIRLLQWIGWSESASASLLNAQWQNETNVQTRVDNQAKKEAALRSQDKVLVCFKIFLHAIVFMTTWKRGLHLISKSKCEN